ncbi:MAG TPA: helix-turn-helix domain-containing protein [Alphaproteobacteria bacterium]|nr:helix-turn-helix domain-containing protein [Alphaproteobacteria bacterium]
MPAWKRTPCPIATTLDYLGDKWTLLVLRDLFRGKEKFCEFLESPEGIPTNILTERLKRLAEAEFITRVPYQDHPVRYAYRLTGRGRNFLPVLQEICRWANREFPETVAPPADLMVREV